MSQQSGSLTSATDKNELVAYRAAPEDGWTLEPASLKREWMDATTGRFAYRCLPLVMANQSGWVVRSPGTICVTWNGKVESDGLTIRFTDGPKTMNRYVLSNFGHGIVSFLLPWVFRTPKGVSLMVRGPTNHWVPNAHPLDGLVETDWISTTFTMNWQMIARNKEAWFRKGDPICMLTPMRVDLMEELSPRIADLATESGMAREVAEFAKMRSETQRQSMEKFAKGEKKFSVFELNYMRGETPTGEKVDEHRTNIKLHQFARDA